MAEKEELIEKYFEATLSAKEQVDFALYLKTDPEFAAEVDFQKTLKEAIKASKKEELKLKLNSYEKNMGKGNKFIIWYAAAAVFICFVIGLVVFDQENDPEKLFQAYYHTYPNVVAPTVRGTETGNLKSQAFYEYDNGEYKTSLRLFSQIYEKDRDDYALFYLSLSLIELGRHQEAIASFEKFDLDKNNGFTPFVKWYKALSYLKTNQKGKAVELLESLAQSSNPQQEMAKKLLSELK